MTCNIYFPDQTRTAEIILSSFKFSELYYNNLKPADDSCTFSIVYTTTLANALKTYINSDIKVQLIDNSAIYYTGYIKKNVNFTKTQRNQPIALTVVSPSYFLDVTTDAYYGATEKTGTYIITQLLTQAGFSSSEIGTIGISTTLPFFSLASGSNIKNVITEMCYEYGKVFYFDREGVFQTGDIFNEPTEYSQTFDGTNIRKQLQITAKEHEADFVRVAYAGVSKFSDTLLFSDTQNSTDDDKCQIEIAASSYYADTEDNLLSADSTEGEVLYIDDLTYFDIEVDSGITYECDLEDTEDATQIHFSAYNSNTSSAYIRQLDIYGDAYIQTETKEEVTTTGTKEKSLNLSYVYTQALAQSFAQSLADYYAYAKFTMQFTSEEECELGDFCIVTEDGVGTFYGRVIKKEYTLTSSSIAYTVESIADYTPATIDRTVTKQKGKNSASNSQVYNGDDGLALYAETTAILFSVDADGNAIETQSVSTEIHLFSGNAEQACTISSVTAPDNVTTSVSDQTITYNVAIGDTFENGNSIITVTYTSGSTTRTMQLSILVSKLVQGETGDGSMTAISSVSALTYHYNKQTKKGYKESNTFTVSLLSNQQVAEIRSITVTNTSGLTLSYYESTDGYSITASSRHGNTITDGNITIVIYPKDKALEKYTDGTEIYSDGTSAYGGDIDTEPYTIIIPVTVTDSGKYLGVVTTEAELSALSASFGDFVVWGGDDVEESELYPGIIYLGLVLKYDGSDAGYPWSKDVRLDHIAAALQDVILYTGSARSAGYTLINRLAANTIFAQKIIANETFTGTLVANEGFVEDLAATELLAENLVANETFTDTLSANSAFAQDLIANSAFISALMAATLTLQNGGIFKSENYDGTSSSGVLNKDGTTGFAMDSEGNIDAINGRFAGLLTLTVYEELPSTLNEGDMFLLTS